MMIARRFRANAGYTATPSPRGCLIMACLILTVVACGPASAQDATQPADDSSAVIEAGDQTVNVEGATDDEEIATRLRNIYEATGRYTSLQVEVDDGVVFIRGSTSDSDFKKQATQIAQRTTDVVAVVNNLLVIEPAVSEVAASEVNSLIQGFIKTLPLIGLGLAVLVAALLMAGLLGRLVALPISHVTESALLRVVVRKLTALLIVLGGLVLFLRITGLTGVAITVVSGTGLFGLVLGFAFRDIAENFLASVLLSISTPFRLGDVIEVNGYKGVVSKVTARGTVLVDFDGNHIQIANADVYKATLKNFSANPKMRQQFTVGIGYDASVEQAQRVCLDVCRNHPTVLDDPVALVLVDALGASTINLKVYFWIDGETHSFLKVRSAVMRQTVRALTEAGISLPDEAREVIFPQGVPIAPRQDNEPVEPASDSRVTSPVSSVGPAVDASAGEGDLRSEVGEIKQQAAESRNPESGADIVVSEKHSPSASTND